jgi:putative ABC transport system permease protein
MTARRRASRARAVPAFSFADALRESAHTLGAHPGRAALSMLCMVIGVAAVVAVTTLQASASEAIARQFDSLGADDLTLEAVPLADGTATAFDEAALSRVRSLPAVASAASVVPIGTRDVAVSSFPGHVGPWTTITVVGVSDGAEATLGGALDRGRWPTAFEYSSGAAVAMVGASAAGRLGLANFVELPDLLVDGVHTRVVGVVAAASRAAELSDAIWLTERASVELLGGAPTTIEVTARPGTASAVARDAPLAAAPYDPGLVGVESAIGLDVTRRGVAADLDGLTAALGIIILGVGGVSIAAMTLVSVLARTHEIAVRRAVGANPRHIFALVLTESGLVGVASTMLGLVVGMASAVAVCSARGWTPVADPTVLWLVPGAALVLTFLAGIVPAVRASVVPPALALRSL